MLLKGKRLICIALGLALLLTLAAGCGSTERTADTKPTEAPVQNNESSTPDPEQSDESTSDEEQYDFGGRVIRYASWWNAGPAEDATPETDKRIGRIAELEEKFNCKFEYVTIPMDQYNEQFTSTTLAGDPMAEIIEMHIMWLYPGHMNKGFLTPLDDLGVFDFTQEKWNKTMMKYGTYKGKHYSMAVGKMAPYAGLFWNKTLFERENLPDLYELQRNYEWTWEKFREIAIKATRDTDGDGSIDQWGLDGVGGQGQFVASNNAFIVKLVDDKPVFGLTDPRAVEALQFYQDLKINDKVHFTAPADAAWDYGLGQFAAGKTAMFMGSYWMTSMIKDSMQDEFGFVFFPMGPQATEYTSEFSGFNFPVMSSALENPVEVALFWDAFTEPYPDEEPDDWIADYENGASDRGTVETIVKMIGEELYTPNLMESFPDLYSLMGTLYGQISLGNMTAQAAIDMISKRAQSILDDYVKGEQSE